MIIYVCNRKWVIENIIVKASHVVADMLLFKLLYRNFTVSLIYLEIWKYFLNKNHDTQWFDSSFTINAVMEYSCVWLIKVDFVIADTVYCHNSHVLELVCCTGRKTEHVLVLWPCLYNYNGYIFPVGVWVAQRVWRTHMYTHTFT